MFSQHSPNKAYCQHTVRGKILEWEKIGEFGELWAIRQYFTRQLFLLMILLATEVTKQLATF